MQDHQKPLGNLHLAAMPPRQDLDTPAQRAAQVRSLPGVRSVVLNGTSGSLSVRYDRSLIAASELQRAWRGGKGESPLADESSGLRWLPMMMTVARALGGACL